MLLARAQPAETGRPEVEASGPSCEWNRTWGRRGDIALERRVLGRVLKVGPAPEPPPELAQGPLVLRPRGQIRLGLEIAR